MGGITNRLIKDPDSFDMLWADHSNMWKIRNPEPTDNTSLDDLNTTGTIVPGLHTTTIPTVIEQKKVEVLEDDVKTTSDTGTGVYGGIAGGTGASGKSLYEMSEEDKKRKKGLAGILGNKKGARGLQIPTTATNITNPSTSGGSADMFSRASLGIRI